MNRNTSEYKNHPLIKVWAGIIARCYTPSASQFDKYGAVGVRVCDEWRNNFKLFYVWCMANGWQKGLQIDKDIKAKKLGIPPLLYSPETCSIVTVKENANNRKSNRLIEYKGEIKTVTQWAEIFGFHKSTIRERLNKGWDVDKVLNEPIDIKHAKRKIKCITTNQEFDSLVDAAKELGVSTGQVSNVASGKRKHTKGLYFEYLNQN